MVRLRRLRGQGAQVTAIITYAGWQQASTTTRRMWKKRPVYHFEKLNALKILPGLGRDAIFPCPGSSLLLDSSCQVSYTCYLIMLNTPK